MDRNGAGVGGEAGVLTEAARRLNREFHGSVSSRVIRAVVVDSRAELDCPFTAALPELVERLARERLRQHLPGV